MRERVDGMKSGFFVTLPLLSSALTLVAAADYGGWIGSLARSSSLSLWDCPLGRGWTGGIYVVDEKSQIIPHTGRH